MDVNFWAVIVAAASSFLLGGLWYWGQFILFRLILGAWH